MAGLTSLARATHAYKAARSFHYSRLGAGVYAAGTLFGWPRFGQLSDPWLSDLVSGSEFDPIRSAGNFADNSAVAICLGVITDCFPEPRLEVVERGGDGTWEAVEGHPLPELLNAPNEIDDFETLSSAWASTYCVDGTAYFVKVRDGLGRVAELQYVPPYQIRPITESPTVAVEYYLYEVEGWKEKYAPSDVIVWRNMRDPGNPRLGRAPLKSLLLEIATDNEANRYTAAILHQMGVCGGILSNIDPEVTMTEEKAEKLRARWAEITKGRNRGGLMVPTFKSQFVDVGRSPEEMALDVIRQIPEARIAAALRVPAMVAGLTSAKESKSYANYAEARESFYEDCLIPLQRRFAAGLTRYLLPEFKGYVPGRQKVRFNYDDVRVLQPDMDKRSTRHLAEWQADAITLNQLLEKLDEKPLGDSKGDVYYSEHSGAMKTKVAPQPVVATDGNDNAAGRTPPFAKKSFDPNEPRDEKGRWAASGGGSAGHVDTKKYGRVSLRAATDEERKTYGIPPAYTDVKVADLISEGSPLMWTAKARNGDTKYQYSAAHTEEADAAKFERVKSLHGVAVAARNQWHEEIASNGKDKHSALALRLVEQTGFRNGGDDAATEIIRRDANGDPVKDADGKIIKDRTPTYGASSLLTSHAKADGNRVHFDFVGKSGVRQRHSVTDSVIADHVRAQQAAGATRLFETNDAKTRAYLKKSSGGDYKVHDLRTRMATMTAATVMERIDARGETPKTESELKTQRGRAIAIAARRIGDSVGVAEEKYVDARLFDRWRVGIKG